MKKLAFALAAGVLAAGVSAQAAEVSSAEYAVITIPVTAGNNLIGISVAATDAAVSAVTDIDQAATVKMYTGSGYNENSASSVTVDTGDAVWYETNAAGTVYELGVVPSTAAAVAVTVSGTMAPVASPFAAPFALTDLTFSDAGSTRYASGNKVHVWNGTGYDTFWYKKGTGWKAKDSGTTVPSAIQPGQGVFVEFGSASSGTVTFAAPHN